MTILATIAFAMGNVLGQALTKLSGCKLVATEWADGDSFLIEATDGTQHTVRELLFRVDSRFSLLPKSVLVSVSTQPRLRLSDSCQFGRFVVLILSIRVI